MGLESSTYIQGLTESWPPTSDLKSQGDDHLRLIKNVLKSTFPSADRPFYFPKTEAVSATIALDATDQNNMLTVDTTAANVAVTLPAGLGAGDKGWECEVLKISSDTNAVIVSPASGSIISKCGATATIRVGILSEPARFIWNGSVWYCSKPGPMIGSTENFDGASVPPGYLLDDGSVFSNTAFAELFAVLGSSTLKDKRGRTEIGVDTGAVNMSVTDFGASPALGATKAGSAKTLLTANLPPQTPAGTITNGTIHLTSNAVSLVGAVGTGGGAFNNCPTTLAVQTITQDASTFTGTAMPGQISTPISLVQPSIVVNKIKRAC